MNISYNGNYIFNVDMIEFVRDNKSSGFDGIVLHKGNKQILVNLKYYIETYIKNYMQRKNLQDISSDELEDKINKMIFMFMIRFDDIIERILYDNDNTVLLLNVEISEYLSENIEKYFGENNGK